MALTSTEYGPGACRKSAYTLKVIFCFDKVMTFVSHFGIL